MREDDVKLGEWWAVLTNGEWFVGKRASAPRARTLEHLHKLNMPFSIQPVTDESGNPVFGANGAPGMRPHTDVLIYPWITDSLDIPEGALWLAVTAVHGSGLWAKLISNSENLKLEARAKRAGITLARH